MRCGNSFLLLWILPGWAQAAGKDAAEPALIILLLLGLAAIIGGIGSLRDIRRKHMLPPRPRPRPPTPPADKHVDTPPDTPSKPHSH